MILQELVGEKLFRINFFNQEVKAYRLTKGGWQRALERFLRRQKGPQPGARGRSPVCLKDCERWVKVGLNGFEKVQVLTFQANQNPGSIG